MGKVSIASAGGAGVGSDECTALKDDVLKGTRAVTADSDDEVVEGTLELTGDAADSQVLAGKTYYNTNPKIKRTGSMVNQGAVSQALNAGGSYTVPAGYHNGSGKVTANSLASQTGGTASAGYILSGQTAWVNGNKLTGTMNVQSILSFSAAVYSSTAISFTWKNPSKGPFSGVIVVGKTGSYPTSINDGTRYYKGSGSNLSTSGISVATVSSFASGTTYYFRAFSYAILNSGEWVHDTSYTAAAATTKGQQVITSSRTFTVPAGVRSIDLFLVGGGGGGSNGDNRDAGSGGGGGYTKTVKGISVTPGQIISVIIGSGGAINSDGGATSFGSYSVSGGKQASFNGGNGGSGGGGGTYRGSDYAAGNGGSNGGNGGYYGGTGQGTTTRAFGESIGTLYAAGGGGGGNNQKGITARGFGGSGGGGNGADAFTGGSAGSANTGGGGGGGYFYAGGGGNGYVGGSGVCIVRWGY